MEVLKKPKIAFVCCYFNPCNYLSKYINFLMFYDKMYNDALYDLFVIESYNKKSEYRINKNCHKVTSVYCNQIFWQKENLLNLQINKIKDKYDYIGWIDCDISFTNPNWFNKVCEEINPNDIFQICSSVKKHTNHVGDFIRCESLAFAVMTKKSIKKTDMLHFRKGEPGYGCIFPTNLINTDKPLYDKAIAGSGDFLNLIGYLKLDNFDDYINNDRFFLNLYEFKKDYVKWRHSVAKVNEIKALKLEIEVSYHGTTENRKYLEREHILRLVEYNPQTDLEKTTRLYKVRNKKAIKLLENYFIERKEDDHLQNSMDSYHFRNKIKRLINKYDRNFSVNSNSFDFVNKLKTIKPKSDKQITEQNGECVVIGVRYFNKNFNLSRLDCDTNFIDLTDTTQHYNYNRHFLHYIIENYENLPDLCFFISENIYNEWKSAINNLIFQHSGNQKDIAYTPIESVKKPVELNKQKHIKRKNEIRYSNFNFESWQKRYIGNHILQFEQNKDGFIVRHGNKERLYFDPKHSFMVSRKYILKNPINKYKSIHSSITKNEGKCEEAVYMSYCWKFLLS